MEREAVTSRGELSAGIHEAADASPPGTVTRQRNGCEKRSRARAQLPFEGSGRIPASGEAGFSH
ncbi:hypothetical protein HMPREF3036_01438 [Sutterella sp. KLE1602]|nr:hypothetical protein HMPREF3036_01438 [Sutterella sp. KLE1602]